ncbi:response regulator [Alkalihalobacillus oceani]|uniref:Response regulator n=1 Tax=Halalkalibacter oceani TaxID=1653776 RepID=A0A9X2DQ59_9BACI|nr:response regulator [Halalkalibacter oceani]MCM3714453.1 response regulator [Halalkalibacter oceani]
MNSTVMVVDDERVIRKTLVKMIEEANGGWSVVGEAGNGEEAIQKMEELSPDLIITDIRMPRMNGIELAKHVYENKQDTRVVILTAYKDFDYAQAAVKYKVTDFLLKPCPPDEVAELLKLVREELLEQKAQAAKQEKINERMIIRSLCLRLPYDPQMANAVETKYAKAEFLLVKVTDFSPHFVVSKPDDLRLVQFSLINIVEELAGLDQSGKSLIPVEYDTFVFMLSRRELNAVRLDELQSKIEALLEISVSIHHVGELSRLEDITRLYSRFYKAGFDSSPDAAASEDVAAYLKHNPTIQELKAKLLAPLMVGEIAHFVALVDDMIKKYEEHSLATVKIEAYSLVYALHSISEKEFQFPLSFNMIEEIATLNESKNKEQVKEWVQRYLADFQKRLEQWKAERSESIIDRVIDYMNQHYMEACQLSDAAASVYLSPKYLSELFKKSTGETFTSYLTKVRIKKAELLLSNTKIKVTEIARMVGYDDPNYFSTVFRKALNCSPNHYRKQKQDIFKKRID